MNDKLKKALDEAAEKYSPPDVKGEVMGDTCFKAGATWILEYLGKDVEFDKESAHRESIRQGYGSGSSIRHSIWEEACIWQFGQDKARIGLADAGLAAQNQFLKTKVKDLEARLAASEDEVVRLKGRP